MTPRMQRTDQIDTAIRCLLTALDPDWETHPDFIDTPKRVAKMYVHELCAGLFEPVPACTSFPKQLGMDQMIVVGPLVVHSLCPHHLAPILGNAWVGVLPGSRLLGLSKYARILRWCMARPAMQETTTEMVADVLEDRLEDAKGVAVVVKAEHLCMKWRGVREAGAITTTTALRGAFLTNPSARAEFLGSVR